MKTQTLKEKIQYWRDDFKEKVKYDCKFVIWGAILVFTLITVVVGFLVKNWGLGVKGGAAGALIAIIVGIPFMLICNYLIFKSRIRETKKNWNNNN